MSRPEPDTDMYSNPQPRDIRARPPCWTLPIHTPRRFLNTALGFILASFSLLVETVSAADAIFGDAQLVQFDSAAFTYPPSPFKLKQAKKQGIEVEPKTEPAVAINGYLAKPGGEQPRAAIVLLHTCAGISEHEESWSKRLVSWDYVVLTVDSLKPRGFDYICDGRTGALTTPWIRALDAWGAKRYLSTLAFVDPERIAVFGLSHGAMTVLEAVKTSTSDGLGKKPFKAAILFYPLCSSPQPIETPALILAGSEDSWTPAGLCEEYVAQMKSRHEISLTVFAGAHHAFDHPGIDAIDVGHVIRSNPEATARAVQMTREFLQEKLR